MAHTRALILVIGLAVLGLTGLMGTTPAAAAWDQFAFIERLSAVGDRSTGTPGCAQAADIIEQTFKELVPGEDREIGRQRLQAPVRMHGESSLTLMDSGKSVPLTPFLGNAISPHAVPPPGIDGPVIYVGRGRLKDFNHKVVEGAVVLMDLASGKNWLNAAALGAKTVIYITDQHTDESPRSLFEDKIELSPINFPRYVMPRAEARELFGMVMERVGPVPGGHGPKEAMSGTSHRDKEQEEGMGPGAREGMGKPPAPMAQLRETPGPQVRIVSEISWQNPTTDNIYCLITGTAKEFSDELLILEAAYDSTMYLPGQSPGASETLSVAGLMTLAARFGQNPPKRSVLLVATSGHAQYQAGMRELVWALGFKSRNLKELRNKLRSRRNRDMAVLKLLKGDNPLYPEKTADQKLAHDALMSVVKDRIDEISQTLMKLRISATAEREKERIHQLTSQRLLFRRISWLEDFSSLADDERQALTEMMPIALAQAGASLADAKTQLACVMSSLALRGLVAGRDIVASVSLHLSDDGDGVGAFGDGWLYDLRKDVNRNRLYSGVEPVLSLAAAELSPKLAGLFKDTLRPSLLRPWESYLPDEPELGGEVAALNGWVGFTLATTHDARPLLGTPSDVYQNLNRGFIARQSELVDKLGAALAGRELPETNFQAVKGFTVIEGRAKLLRMGELFPDRPATGTVVQIYHWQRYAYAMVDSVGDFRAVGLCDRKQSLHKTILEAYKFDPLSGRVIWAVDKRITGKDAYRIKVKRQEVETDLVMFAAEEITLFNMLEPRTFRNFYRIELLDGRTEAEPLRYWYSRLDTHSSSVTTIFLEPEAYLKTTLSDTVLGRKMLLLNSSEDNPEGRGYSMAKYDILTHTEFRAARDMWYLLDKRIKNLKTHGISNQRIEDLRVRGMDDLSAAKQAFKDLEYDRFFEKSRASWALATRVYTDIEQTQKDVLFGVLFYVALFIPFAYCLERVIFAFSDIHRRILAFLGILGLTIFIIYNVHPAFELTYSPMVVILAFFIVGLSILVSGIIFFRFEQEMVNLQRRSRHLKQTDISRFKAFAAAFAIGVTNLRRRPLRTLLTCATLVILTFTIMNFTAVKSSREHGRVWFSDRVPYHGILLRTINWSDLPVEALDMTRGAFGGRGVMSPRVWYESYDREHTKHTVIPVDGPAGEQNAMGLVGLSAQEPQVSHMDQMLCAGRWFTADERHAVILPQAMAKKLGVIPDKPGHDQVTIWGMPFTVVGCFGQGALAERADLDDEPITPVNFPSEAATEISEAEAEALESGEDVAIYQGRYQHVDPDQTMIIPYNTLLSLGGSLKGMAFKPAPGVDPQGLSRELTDRFGLMLFLGGQDGTYVYYAADTLGYSGVPNLIIPLLIAVLIVLNTMIGSVYERKREIGVYTSVGLAPSHVSFLFVAESLAFAVVSVVAGYLMAQAAAHFLAGSSLWSGMTANYSSMAGVGAMVLVITVVLISSIYPSKVAAQIAIPDVNRSWTMPEPKGNVMEITLPFLIKIPEQGCAGGFLQDYYTAHQDVSHGLFSTEDVDSTFACPAAADATEETRELECYNLNLKVWMAPFDFGVRQTAEITFCPAKSYPGFLEIRIRLKREAGEEAVWRRLSKSFINDLRKQLLIWRSLDETAKESYEKRLMQSMGLITDGESA